jgi:hypothetical protein
VVADGCGAWDAPAVLAKKDDVLEITQQLFELVSPPIAVQVR